MRRDRQKGGTENFLPLDLGFPQQKGSPSYDVKRVVKRHGYSGRIHHRRGEEGVQVDVGRVLGCRFIVWVGVVVWCSLFSGESEGVG